MIMKIEIKNETKILNNDLASFSVAKLLNLGIALHCDEAQLSNRKKN